MWTQSVQAHRHGHACAPPWFRTFIQAVRLTGTGPACTFVLAAGVLGGCAKAPPTLVQRPADPPTAVWIGNARVLDVESGVVSAPQDVLLTGDRITALTPAGVSEPPAGAHRLDGSGGTLLPGLIDMHGHIAASPKPLWQLEAPDVPWNLQAYLYCGVTSVMDPADSSGEAAARRTRVANGELLGPSIVTADRPITGTGSHPVPLFRAVLPWWLAWYVVPRAVIEVDSLEAARTAVADVVGQGADVVKVIVDQLPLDAPRMSRDVLEAITAEAQARGTRVVAHIGTVQDAMDAGEAGCAMWVHGVYKETIPDEAIPVLAAFGMPMVATLEVFENYARSGLGPRVPTSLEQEMVPQALLDAFFPPPADFALEMFDATIELFQARREAKFDNVRRLHAAGVTILAGSDVQSGVFPGAALHRELALLQRAGLTPAEAIRAATWDAARVLADRADPDFGKVAVGLRADLLLVEGDPTADLEALSRIRAVVHRGVPLLRNPVAAPGVSE